LSSFSRYLTNLTAYFAQQVNNNKTQLLQPDIPGYLSLKMMTETNLIDIYLVAIHLFVL
jgi:hypothetical protein